MRPQYPFQALAGAAGPGTGGRDLWLKVWVSFFSRLKGAGRVKWVRHIQKLKIKESRPKDRIRVVFASLGITF